jgi:hypothetical protein
MKMKTNQLIRAILLCAALAGLTPAGAQTLIVSDSTSYSCHSDGRIIVSVSGGTAPYTYTLTSSYGVVYGPVTQNSPVFANLQNGSYQIIVSDVNGLNNTASPGYAYIGANFYAYINVYPAICPATTGTEAVYAYTNGGASTDAVCGGAPGQISAYASGGNSPYSFLWNNGSAATVISGITQSSSYSCVVTDAAGCKVSDYNYVQSISPVSISYAVTDASCIYTADGRALMIASGGTPPYIYSWPNGQNSASATGFLTGDYYGYATDANGCSSWGNVFHIGYTSTQPCAVEISGNVIDDFDANCQLNGPDQYLNDVWIGCLPNGGYRWTNGGHYDFILPPGNYSLAEAPPLYHTVVCPSVPSNITLTAGQISANNDFYNKPDTITDLSINCIPYSPPVAGFTQHSVILVRNLGNLTETPDVAYQHALDITFQSSNPAPDTYNPATGKLTWSGPLLASNGTNSIDLYFYIPANLPQGHILNNSDTVFPFASDLDTFNNFEDIQGIVVGSYDPNYVDVSPKGTGTPGFITTYMDTTLRYVVHFQNTGTYPATYVTLKIPVDANLDISTFRLIGASHPVSSISADNNRLLTIRFDHINLADSSRSRLGSQGFAAFTFRQKASLQPLSTINEHANIYFDFNTPVPTNTTLNTIETGVGIREISSAAFSI